MPKGPTNRREFIAALGGAGAWPLVARGQQPVKIPKVGILWHAGNEQEEAPFLGALRRGLNDLGYREGRNVELVNRFADEHYERFGTLATELVEANVDVIVASIPSAASAAKNATSTTPVILAYGAEWVVQELAHPSGNITGLSAMFLDLPGKQMEILKGSISNCSAMALLEDATSKFSYNYTSRAQEAADSLHVPLYVIPVRSPDELEQAFSIIANAHADALLIPPSGVLFQQRDRVAQLALAAHMPTMSFSAEMAEAGVLMSYGTDVPDLLRRTATYIDKILKGAKPADLPVEQPTKFEFIINLKTANRLGLTIPPSVLARADKVIE